MRIYKGTVIDPNSQIIFYHYDGCICEDPTLKCVDKVYQVGFSMSNIDVDDASEYSISLMYGSGLPQQINTDSLLYVYRKWQCVMSKYTCGFTYMNS